MGQNNTKIKIEFSNILIEIIFYLMKYSRSSSPHLLVIWASRDFSLEKASSRSNSSSWNKIK